MYTLTIHSSAFPRVLLDTAVNLLGIPHQEGGNPLQTRWLIQPGRLWERDLRRRLAADKGIAAGLTFGSLRLSLERAFRMVCPNAGLMDENQLYWSILNLLFSNKDNLASIGLSKESAPAEWLKMTADDASMGRVHLARIFCGILDDHATHRPAEVLAWLNGMIPAHGDEAWIAGLARALWGDRSRPRPLSLHLNDFVNALNNGPKKFPGLPALILSVLTGAQPKAYLQALGALAMVCPVHLLVLETCERGITDQMQTWQSVRAEWKKTDRKKDLKTFIAENKWLVPGTLQAYWGYLGILLQQQLVDLEEALAVYKIAVEDKVISSDLEGDTVLRVLQRDVKETCELRPKEKRVDRTPDDPSLVLINAPSPLRELEGARDAIRGALESDRTLNPSDVLMVLADTTQYAPLLPAVFGASSASSGPDNLPRIPWHLADRSLRSDSDTMAAVLDLMEACRERMTLPVISELLAQPAIQARLGFRQEEATQMVEYLKMAGFRWGVGREDRKVLDQPGKDDGMWTLDFALRRLAAGFVHPDRVMDPVGGDNGVTPLPLFEGLAVERLSVFLQWARDLESAREQFASEKPIGPATDGPLTWLGWLYEWMPRLLETGGEREGQSVWLAAVTRTLARGALELGTNTVFSADAFISMVTEAVTVFEQTLPIGQGIGGMTVASPRMARALPAKVIVVVGLSDGAWPRQDPLRPRGLLSNPCPGDRMRRAEDRLATLEWVLSAENMLVWTWRGRDPQTGAPIPASVVVGELQDVCKATFKTPDPFVRELSLHAFDRKCFDGVGRSFDKVAADAARKLHGPGQDADRGGKGTGCVALPVNEKLWGLEGLLDFAMKGEKPDWSPDQWTAFAEQLVRFWRLPCQAFLKSIGVETEDEYEILPDREALELNALDDWNLRDLGIRELLKDPKASAETAARRLKQAGRLPPGKSGVETINTRWNEAQTICDSASKLAGADSLPCHISGMRWAKTGKLVRVTASKEVKGKHLLQAWIEQMVLSVMHGEPVSSHVVGLENKETLAQSEPGSALKELQKLSALALLGTSFPLPCFPAASSEYINVKAGIEKALDLYWEGGYDTLPPPESESPACRIAFRGMDPFVMKLPKAPESAGDWDALISSAGLTHAQELFPQIASIVYGFIADIEKAKAEKKAKADRDKEEAKKREAGEKQKKKADGRKGKKS